VTRDARLRLEALQRSPKLGSGFGIATARPGDPRRREPAGKDQSGPIEAVGFDL